MWWQYFLVFIGSLIVDIVPFPLPPAFTVMVFFQIRFDLNIWWVIVFGVIGSILGRFILTLYIPKISKRIFTDGKNEDIHLLGSKMNNNKWKSMSFILIYSLMPMPTTPLFIASGMARMKTIYIIPPFIIGKFTSDMVAVFLGKYAAENTSELLSGLISWKTITGLVVGILLIVVIIYIDWRSLLIEKRFRLKFKIWK